MCLADSKAAKCRGPQAFEHKNSPFCQNQDGERKGEGSLSFQTDDAPCAVQRPRAYGGPRGHLLHPTSHAGTVPKEEVCDDGLTFGVEPTEKSPQTVTCLRGLRYSEGSISVAALAAATVHCILAAIGNGVESVGKAVDEVVGNTADAEEHHACHAEEEGGAAVAVNPESGERILVGDDVHGLDDKQVVVERDDGVDQCNEHQPVPSGVEGCHEDEELREEACKRGDTCEREEAERHEERQLWVALVEAVVAVDGDAAGVLLYHGDDGKGSEVGHHIDEEVEYQRCHTLCRSVHQTEYEVSGL